MKAWRVGDNRDDWEYDYTILIHAKTREKARKISIDIWPEYYDLEYKNIRAIRVPELDNLPFTDENVAPIGIYRDTDEQPLKDSWYNFCNCEICNPK